MRQHDVREWVAALGGRRFLMCMGAHIINTLLLVFERLSEGGYITAFMGTVAVYVAANTYQKQQELRSD
jgi:hypothetical protein